MLVLVFHHTQPWSLLTWFQSTLIRWSLLTWFQSTLIRWFLIRWFLTTLFLHLT
jgi:hypothetical protein